MRRVMSVGCLLLAVVSACSETTTPVVISSPIVGAWMAPRENLQPNGTMTKLGLD